MRTWLSRLKVASTPAGVAWLLFVLSLLAVHVSLIVLSGIGGRWGREMFGDEALVYWPGASQLVAGVDWYPEPLWPPLYPRLLAAVLTVGGTQAAVRGLQLALLLAVALLLADLTRRWSGSRTAGFVAGSLVLFYPPLAAFAHYLWPEVVHLFFFVAALWILAARGNRPVWLVAAGLILGLALLTKSLLGPFLPVLLVPLALEGRWRRRLLRPALVALGVAVAVAPTVADNRRRGTGVLIADSSAFNLWVGLNDRARTADAGPRVIGREWRAYHESAETFTERNEILRQKIRDLIRERGAVRVLRDQLGRQYFRLFDKDSFLTDQLPGGVIAARGRGYRDPPRWIAAALRGLSYVLYATVMVGAVVGMAVRPPRGQPWLWVVFAFLIYNLVILLGFHVKSRYRVQMLPFFFLYAGCATAWAAARLGLNPGEADLWRHDPGRRGWAAASLTALLLLFLAFGRSLVD